MFLFSSRFNPFLLCYLVVCIILSYAFLKYTLFEHFLQWLPTLGTDRKLNVKNLLSLLPSGEALILIITSQGRCEGGIGGLPLLYLKTIPIKITTPRVRCLLVQKRQEILLKTILPIFYRLCKRLSLANSNC